MSTQLLRLELIRRIADAYPTAPMDRREAMAAELESTGAYAHDGVRVVPAGDRQQMARASAIAPAVAAKLTTELVAAASAASSSQEAAPADRARARLASMGIVVDDAFESPEEDAREFMGVDLSQFKFTPPGAA